MFASIVIILLLCAFASHTEHAVSNNVTLQEHMGKAVSDHSNPNTSVTTGSGSSSSEESHFLSTLSVTQGRNGGDNHPTAPAPSTSTLSSLVSPSVSWSALVGSAHGGCDEVACVTAAGGYAINTALCDQKAWVRINASAADSLTVWTGADNNASVANTTCEWGLHVPRGFDVDITLDRLESPADQVFLLYARAEEPVADYAMSTMFYPLQSSDLQNSALSVRSWSDLHFRLLVERSASGQTMAFRYDLVPYVPSHFDFRYSPLPAGKVSDTSSYVTSPNCPYFHYNLKHCFNAYFELYVPKMYSVLISFRRFHLNPGQSHLTLETVSETHDYSDVYKEVWMRTGFQVMPAQMFRSSIRLIFWRRRWGELLPESGFKMEYALLPTSQAPVQVGENLFNCSVPSFRLFQPVFRCDLLEECVGGEDEEGCDFHSHDCGLGAVDEGTKCYRYVRR